MLLGHLKSHPWSNLFTPKNLSYGFRPARIGDGRQLTVFCGVAPVGFAVGAVAFPWTIVFGVAAGA